LARGLILKPDLLVLDEPFASLDEFTKEELDDELLRLNQEFGTAILLVTHSIDEAVYIANTTYILRADTAGLRRVKTNISRQGGDLSIRDSVSFIKAT